MRGDADAGDYLMPSGRNDGTAIAVSEENITFDQYRDAIEVVLQEFERPDGEGRKQRLQHLKCSSRSELVTVSLPVSVLPVLVFGLL